MKRLASILFLLWLCFGARAANPSFTDFSSNEFSALAFGPQPRVALANPLNATNITILVSNVFATNIFTTNLTVTNSITNQSLTASQFMATDTGKKEVSTLNGSTLTNLTYQYTTNAIPAAASLSFGTAYFTNLTRDITLPAFTISGSAFYETVVLQITNGDSATHTITMPSGTVGPPGSGTPAKFYCTNAQQTIILVSHFGTGFTNAWVQPFAP